MKMLTNQDALAGLYSDEKERIARERENELRLASGLGRAASTIGSAFSGAPVDQGAYDTLDKQASAPVEQLKQQRQSALEKMGAESKLMEIGRLAAAQDPNGRFAQALSGLNRKTYGIDTTGMNANELKDLEPTLARIDAAEARNQSNRERKEDRSDKETVRKTELGEKNIRLAQQEFENSATIKAAREGIVASDDVVALLASNNPVADETSKSRIARLAGEVGVLTDNDIKRYAGSKATAASLAQSLQQMTRGTLTPTNRAYLLDVAKTMVERRRSSLAKEADKKAGQLAIRHKMDKKEAYKWLVPDMQYDQGDKEPSEDNAAMEWAKQNPNDPRAKQILMMQGGVDNGKL